MGTGHLDGESGLRKVRPKGARTRDVRLPSDVTQFMKVCMEQVLVKQIKKIGCETPLVQHLKRAVAFCYEEGASRMLSS